MEGNNQNKAYAFESDSINFIMLFALFGLAQLEHDCCKILDDPLQITQPKL